MIARIIKNRRVKLWFNIFAILLSLLLDSCSISENQRRLSFVPNGLNISKILYAKEESWGFGPGGNETGVIVSELSDEIVSEINQKGSSFFSTLPDRKKTNEYNDWHGVFYEWRATPIEGNSWKKYTSCECVRDSELKARSELKKPMLFNYLNQYGFYINIDEKIEAEIDDSISSGNSYYSYGRIGVFIIMPLIKKAAFIYNG